MLEKKQIKIKILLVSLIVLVGSLGLSVMESSGQSFCGSNSREYSWSATNWPTTAASAFCTDGSSIQSFWLTGYPPFFANPTATEILWTCTKTGNPSQGCWATRPAAPPATTCSDSDGTNIYTQGTVTYFDGSSTNYYTDYCPATSQVGERICDASNIVRNSVINCPANHTCSGGKCVCNPIPQSVACAGHDGDFMSDGCSGAYACPSPCTDSDGGNNLYVRGTAVGLASNDVPSSATDYCSSLENDIVYEMSCAGYYIDVNWFECPGAQVCWQGICVDPAPSNPISLTLSASPTAINLGQSTTLTYNVSGATSCTASVTAGGGNWTGAKVATTGTHTYPGITPTTAGTKTYSLSCSNSTNSISRSVNVSAGAAPANSAPTAVIDLPTSNQTINVGDSITFTGSGTDTDGSVTGYSWNIGSCGGTSISGEQSFTYPFSTAGTFTVYLVVFDDKGAASTNCPYRTITVSPASLPVCVECNENNKSNVCTGKTFESCSGPCAGTKECDSSWQEVLP